jgi:hypothetical protein
MSQWEGGRERSRDEAGAVEQLFSGRGRDAVTEPSESQLFEPKTALTIQLHRIKTKPPHGVGWLFAQRI